MKAAIYCRVSSDIQVEGFSISAQLSELKEYCIKNNIDIYGSYIDEGISGTKEDRPQFQKMIADAEKKLFDVILVHKFDRFARKVEISQRIKSRLKKANVNVVSITEPIEDSPIGFFQEGLLELLSEYYIKNLSNEIKKGKKERASQGYINGVAPFGYKTENSKLSIVEENAKVVRLIFEMFLEGKTYGKIATFLNSSNIKTPNGALWEHSGIRRIINNPLYGGLVKFNDELYELNTTSIISKEMWQEAQRDKGTKGNRYTYRTDRQAMFLFLGLLRCGNCGWNMRIQYTVSRGKKYQNYVCNNSSRYHSGATCDFKKFFHAQKLENKLLQIINEHANSLSIENMVVEKSNNLVDIVDNRKTKIQKELERARQAYLSEVFSLDEYSQLRMKLEKELSELYNIPSPAPSDTPNKIKSAMQQFENIDPLDIPSRKKLLKSFIKSINISESGIEIIYL